MKKIKPFLYLSLFLFSLTLQAQEYQSAESVEYDPTQNRWLASNGSNIIARASDGALSFFGSGSATHGMEVMGNTLFAVDGGTIRGYDLTSEQQVMSIAIPGASFLNGMTNDGNGTLYVTDFGAQEIHKIDVSDLNNPSSEMIVSNATTTPNGIIYDGANNRLLFTSWQSSNAPIKAVDLTDFSVSTVVTTNVGRIDGIDDDSDGNYYISSWSPARISKYDNAFTNPPEIVTTPFISNPADIGYSMQTDTLAIPVGNNVVFVGFSPMVAVDELPVGKYQLSVFPNPLSPESVISFELEKSETVELQIFTTEGRLVENLLTGVQPAGQHRVVLTGMTLSAGIYFCRLQTPAGILSQRIIVQ